MTDREMRLPLHTALIPQALSYSEMSVFGAFVAASPAQPSAVLADVVDILLDAFPDACREVDIYGNLALHCAAAFAPLAVVERVYQRFPGVEGSAYFIGGLGVNYQRSGRISLAPIRAGVGFRTGVNVGYLSYTEDRDILPF
jgi:hypothetical protein